MCTACLASVLTRSPLGRWSLLGARTSHLIPADVSDRDSANAAMTTAIRAMPQLASRPTVQEIYDELKLPDDVAWNPGDDFDGDYLELGYTYSLEDEGVDLSIAATFSDDLPDQRFETVVEDRHAQCLDHIGDRDRLDGNAPERADGDVRDEPARGHQRTALSHTPLAHDPGPIAREPAYTHLPPALPRLQPG